MVEFSIQQDSPRDDIIYISEADCTIIDREHTVVVKRGFLTEVHDFFIQDEGHSQSYPYQQISGIKTLSMFQIFKKKLRKRMYNYRSPEQVMAHSDVQLENSRLLMIYCVLNIIFYLAQMLILTLIILNVFGTESVLNPNLNVPRSPLYVSQYMTDIGWISCFVLQGLFALRGLAGAKNSEHYKNCLMLKIKFSFMALCLLFMISFVLASVLESQSQLNKYLNATLVILEIFLLKVVIYLFIYRPIKYKDDGRELVSWFEFLTIHVTFPVLNAWVTYQLVYNMFIILAMTCPFPV
jgi:hypothetical protein